MALLHFSGLSLSLHRLRFLFSLHWKWHIPWKTHGRRRGSEKAKGVWHSPFSGADETTFMNARGDSNGTRGHATPARPQQCQRRCMHDLLLHHHRCQGPGPRSRTSGTRPRRPPFDGSRVMWWVTFDPAQGPSCPQKSTSEDQGPAQHNVMEGEREGKGLGLILARIPLCTAHSDPHLFIAARNGNVGHSGKMSGAASTLLIMMKAAHK